MGRRGQAAMKVKYIDDGILLLLLLHRRQRGPRRYVSDFSPERRRWGSPFAKEDRTPWSLVLHLLRRHNSASRFH